MKLYEIINTLQQIASAQPAVNSVFEGSVYQLNELKDIKYASVVISQEQHTQDRDFITYNFNIFYVDRLTADASNRLSVQSTALDVLANIVLAMDELGFDFSNVYYNTFTQRFEAECAGAYATVSFLAPAELCADWYDIIVSNIRAEGNGYSILDKYATKEWVEDNFSGGTGGGVSPQRAQEMIDEAIDAETARTEDTYLKIGALDGYATEKWVEDKHYLTSADTQNFLTSADTQDFITTADTAEFATTAETQSAITSALSGYATEEWVREQGYVTSRNVIHIQEISQSDYDELVDNDEVDPFTLYLIPEE